MLSNFFIFKSFRCLRSSSLRDSTTVKLERPIPSPLSTPSSSAASYHPLKKRAVSVSQTSASSVRPNSAISSLPSSTASLSRSVTAPAIPLSLSQPTRLAQIAAASKSEKDEKKKPSGPSLVELERYVSLPAHFVYLLLLGFDPNRVESRSANQSSPKTVSTNLWTGMGCILRFSLVFGTHAQQSWPAKPTSKPITNRKATWKHRNQHQHQRDMNPT